MVFNESLNFSGKQVVESTGSAFFGVFLVSAVYWSIVIVLLLVISGHGGKKSSILKVLGLFLVIYLGGLWYFSQNPSVLLGLLGGAL